MVRTPVSILSFLLPFAVAASGAPENPAIPAAQADAAADAAGALVSRVDSRIAALIGEKYPGARIEIRAIHPAGAAVSDPSRLEWSRDDGKGIAYFREGASAPQEIAAEFSAWKKSFVAVRRVRPGERLERAFFELKEIDVSRGMAREYRGLMLGEETVLEALEADQSILEGHFPLLSGVREIPDIRRGEMVKLRILSGGLQLSTQATASEEGRMGRPIKVMTVSTKRQLTGTLREDGAVEVSL